MADREIKVGLMSYVRADGPEDTVLWGFGLYGATVDVHDDDLERFDRLNGPAAPTEPPPLVVLEQEDDYPEEPPRSGRGSGVEAWTEFAQSRGIEVPEDASRDQIVALVDEDK